MLVKLINIKEIGCELLSQDLDFTKTSLADFQQIFLPGVEQAIADAKKPDDEFLMGFREQLQELKDNGAVVKVTTLDVKETVGIKIKIISDDVADQQWLVPRPSVSTPVDDPGDDSAPSSFVAA